MYDESGQRIKFTLERLDGPVGHDSEREAMAGALGALLRLKGLSWSDGGKSVGNLAMRVDGGLIVSRSGREPHAANPTDFVKVVSFDKARWHAAYRSDSESAQPSSDTPLHWASLIEMPARMRWPQAPLVAIHGHDLNSEAIARALGCPISTRGTEFSTPEDLHELEMLLTEYPYPANKAFIRRNHGFFALGSDIETALKLVSRMVEKALKLKP